ncbi:hypothetical protein [Actinoplanes sp. TFC3]|uniref:hypothetical protein n=1 Tax=Actinoplanes sp. TFC3 TaxID=1710355 RepID=UPI00128FDA17|nr:hypothetical protein [Actinoplanes sp. TFC3]
MDESGNGNPSQPLILGAVEIDEDFEDVDKRVVELYRNLSARRSLMGLASFEKFREHGFHASTDPVEVSVPFSDLMQDIHFRAYVYVTDRSSAYAGYSEKEQLEYMYETMLGDLLLRFRNLDQLSCVVEENEMLKTFFGDLPTKATRRAIEKLGRALKLPQLEITVAAKKQAMSMAIIDYLMLTVSRWIQAKYTTEPANRVCRALREVEPYMSVLYSLEHGVISSRKAPLH